MDAEYIAKIQANEDRSKSNTKRIDEHEEKLKELTNVYVALTKVDNKVTNVENDVSEMKCDLKELKEKPSKKMDLIWGNIMSAVVGAIITFLAVKLGLK